MISEIDSSLVFDQLLNEQVVYVADKDFNVVFASNGATKLFEELNHTSKSPIGTKCYRSFKRRDAQCENCRAESLLKSETGNSYVLSDMVCKRYDKDGETYIIHYLFDPRFLDWVGEYSQKIITASKESIVVTDLGGIVIETNPAFEREMGYTDAEVKGKSNRIFYLDAEESKKVTNGINKDGKIVNHKTHVRTKDKRIRHIELTAWVTKRGDDDVIVRVSKFSEKIEVLRSMIRITENILVHEHGNLHLIVEETANLLNSKYCVIYSVSDNGETLVLQAAHGSEYMEKAKEITYDLNWNAQTDNDFDGITPMVAVSGHAFEAGNWNDVITHPAYKKGKIDRIYLDNFFEKDFENRFAVYMIPLILGDEVKGVFRIEYKNDGSKYTEVDKEIFGLMGRYAMVFLKEQKQLRKTVLGDIAHLTRSPIAEAITNLSLVSNKEILGKMSISELEEAMRLVKNAIMQANITNDNLIVWSTDSSETGKTQSIRVKDVISKITRLFEAFTTKLMFKVDVKDSDTILLSITEQIKLEIILQNVIHNSIKYSHTYYVEINISGKVSDGDYKIKISDHGVGMTRKDMANVWKEFYKGDSSKYDRERYGSVRGLGMGLSSIKKICAETEWQPELSSKGVGKGTTFVLKIPMRRREHE